MSWRYVDLPIRSAVYNELIDEDGYLYLTSAVDFGGNWRLIKCNLNQDPPTCQSLDTGVPIPSTDGHYNHRFILDGRDGYLYACWMRWTGLQCYRFRKDTGAGQSIGSISPAGHSDLNYCQMTKIKEDYYLMVCRCGDGTQQCLFKFKGSPSQLLDGALWEKPVPYLFNDAPVPKPDTCPEGSIPYSYSHMVHWSGRYVGITGWNRCSNEALQNNKFIFGVILFDVLTEKFYNVNLQEVTPPVSTTDPSVRLEAQVPPEAGITCQRLDAPMAFPSPDGSKIASGSNCKVGATDNGGVIIVDRATRSGTWYKNPNTGWNFVVGWTSDGKVIVTGGFLPARQGYTQIFDPATRQFTTVLNRGNMEAIRVNLGTEDVYLYTPYIIVSWDELILPPWWRPWANALQGLRKPKRVTVTSPATGQLRVQAEFFRTPSQIKIEIYKTDTPTPQLETQETLAGATSIDRTYNVSAGKKRVVVTALP